MTIRFAFFTDTHHFPGAPHDFGAPKMLTRSKEVLDILPSVINAGNFDFVVHGGDIVCGGSSFNIPNETFVRSLEEAAATFEKITTPFYSVPGNHDCDADSWTYDQYGEYFSVHSPITLVDVAPKLRLALANVFYEVDVKKNGSGLWTDAMDESLRQAAVRACQDECAIILILHSWILPSGDGDIGLISKAKRLRQTIEDCSCISMVFTGHRHMNRITEHNDYLVIDTACLIGFPLGYREVILSENGSFTTHFHTLRLPKLIQDSRNRSTDTENHIWEGKISDRNTEIAIPRLKKIWTESTD
ncbi:MAG: metallophosphoesterase [Candidatus Latescibacterota bacterium]|nr:metallophosphoesterase [Candidatus Latescibacterota bacterium]